MTDTQNTTSVSSEPIAIIPDSKDGYEKIKEILELNVVEANSEFVKLCLQNSTIDCDNDDNYGYELLRDLLEHDLITHDNFVAYTISMMDPNTGEGLELFETMIAHAPEGLSKVNLVPFALKANLSSPDGNKLINMFLQGELSSPPFVDHVLGQLDPNSFEGRELFKLVLNKVYQGISPGAVTDLVKRADEHNEFGKEILYDVVENGLADYNQSAQALLQSKFEGDEYLITTLDQRMASLAPGFVDPDVLGI